MTETDRLTEADLTLITALQISPRASWAQLARATATAPATVARHWRRLEESGVAWVTATPGRALWSGRCVAFCEIRCAPGAVLQVAQTLADDPHALTVELTTGATDIFMTAAVEGLSALSRYLLQRVDLIPGVLETRTNISTRLYRDGSDWRLDALPARSVALSQHDHGTSRNIPRAAVPDSAVHRSLLVGLGIDGRASCAALAERAGINEITARRHLARLLQTGATVLRTEVAAGDAGWPVSVLLSFEVPTGALAEAARATARHRQVRMSATLAGSPSLMLAAWLRRVDELHDFERSIATDIPAAVVTNRLVVLRTVKRMGRLLDESGRAVGAVPMDHWRDPVGAT